jgi:hypothetical protein
MDMKATIGTVLALGLVLGAQTARASEHELYYAQAGAMLDYAGAEVRILYAAVTQRIFDPTITRQASDELERTLEQAKRQVRRTGALLPESMSKHEDAVGALEEQIIGAERQLEKFDTIVEAAITALTADEDELEEGEEPPETDWAALRSSCAWLAKDIEKAKRTHAGVARRLGMKPLRSPPTPRGERPAD